MFCLSKIYSDKKNNTVILTGNMQNNITHTQRGIRHVQTELGNF